MNRDEKQEKVVQQYLQHKPTACTLLLSTGFGKSRVALRILQEVKPAYVLILVNADHLRDKSWKDEFEKFGMGKFYEKKVKTANYQSAYKWTKKKVPLKNVFIIADEVDFAGGTQEYSKFFDEYKGHTILGLTGFITESKRSWFNQNLPVFYTYTAQQAQSEKVLNKIDFIFVKYDLSKNPKDMTVTYKKGGSDARFTQSQNNAYDYNEKKLVEYAEEKKKADRAYMMNQIGREDYAAAHKRWKYLNERVVVPKRAEILLNNINGAKITQRLIEYFLNQHDQNKIVVFSKRTAQSITICGEDYVYNGAIPKKKAEENYAAFKAGDKRVLGVCSKLNRGANIDGLNIAIFESFDGSDTEAAQRLGRIMRLGPDDRAVALILLPYYMQEGANRNYTVQETKQVSWAREMIRNSKLKASDGVIWDYRVVKQD